MDVRQVLRELVGIPEQRQPVASVFLNTWWANEHQREAVRVFVQDHVRRAMKGLPNEESRERLAATLRPVETYVEGLLRQRFADGAAGVALFSSAPLRLFRVIATGVPFEPMALYLEPRPNVVPIARTLAMVPDIVVAAVDSEGGTILEADGSLTDLEARIERPFPGFHHRGGWSQRRFGRHLGELRDRNLRAVADPLTRLSDRKPSACVVLAGQVFILSAFEALLPERVRERVVARLPLPSAATEGELRLDLLRDAAPAVEKAMLARLQKERDETLDEASRAGGMGTLGLDDTLRALTEGRAHRVFIEQGFSSEMQTCSQCNSMLDGASSACGYCGGAPRPTLLPDELVRRAVLADADVAFLPPGVSLPTGAGIAAQLRHRQGPSRFMSEAEGEPASVS